ncbi:CopG family transcriptional regulator [Rhizobium sp. AQ_MP]|uniref:CopG family ribbon-helix-helix protein n=1 Tax=Rhizobium sp. AQ_MP TaxID=2761536 RepID=UPI00163B0D96|nr:CopG family transcriptional regulator [Rhizobium sp. AQ_MP]MBC2771356.1 CopG family transcriptional regulator [Rhizobium sp. AQ_MP]
MSSRTTMTIEIRQDVKDQLDALASGADQSSQRLAEEAVTAFVEQELALRQSIEKGLAQGRTGDTVAHSDAIAEMRAMIAAVRDEQAARG